MSEFQKRIVHARGSGAHGYFEVTNPIPHLTGAWFLAEKGKKTELFARFSTVAGVAGDLCVPRGDEAAP
jgi:catalase